MDDPLRPKTVPLSAETILWFEFLLDPSLLTEHLAKQNTCPTPIELISKFLSIAPDNQNNSTDITTPEIEGALNRNEGLKIGRKQLALKILGLKVASHLKWNLQVLEKNLTLQKQVQLLSDLCSVTSGKIVNLPLSLVHECTLGPEGSKQAFNFALTQYHRWVLRAQVLKEIPPRIFKQGFSHILATQEQANSFRDEMFISSLEPFTQTSIDFLKQMCETDDQFLHLTFDSFVELNQNLPPDRLAQNFVNAKKVSKAELKAQICFDLCRFYLHQKKYELAKESVVECRENHLLTIDEYKTNGDETGIFLFSTFTEEELNGCLMACGVADDVCTGLLLRMNESVMDQYKNIAEILKQDNLQNEIPLVNRRILELDVEGSHSAGVGNISQELVVQVAALNNIKCIIADDDPFGTSDYILKYQEHNSFSVLIELFVEHMAALNTSKTKSKFNSDIEKIKIKQYLRNLLLSLNDEPKAEDIQSLQTARIFTSDEIEEIDRLKLLSSGTQIKDIVLPSVATMSDWKMSEVRNALIEIGAVKRQIISCTSATAVRKLLVKLAKAAAESNQSQQLEPWHINPSWLIPISIKSILMSLSRGFMQDFSYILIAKSKEMVAKNEFKPALAMMNALKTETLRTEYQNTQPINKLSKLIDYEIVLFQITQTLEEWPQKVLENSLMISKCKQCLMAAQNSDSVSPRVDILDACAAMLLNLNESASLVTFEKRFPSSELYSAIASSIVELDQQQKSNTNKKVCREAWDLVLSMFITNSTAQNNNKRNSANNAGASSSTNPQTSPTLIVSTNLWPFLKKLRDVLPISIILSLLAKLHNILYDESTMELNVEHMHLWPTSISNASAYSIDVVSETLNNLLKQSLKYHPHQVQWIRLRGDLEYRNENFEAAMAYYVSTIITGSEYCTLHLQRQLDDYIIRRMIKCSSSLGSCMQAAILCQFLEEIDYSLAFKTFSDRTAFKAITEKSTNFSDAMDSYYNCIWDPTLLEFIVNLQSKKGEHKRKQQAIATLGQLELNANNNEEVKREAAAIRRTRFLRCLAKQYIL